MRLLPDDDDEDIYTDIERYTAVHTQTDSVDMTDDEGQIQRQTDTVY